MNGPSCTGRENDPYRMGRFEIPTPYAGVNRIRFEGLR